MNFYQISAFNLNQKQIKDLLELNDEKGTIPEKNDAFKQNKISGDNEFTNCNLF